MRKKIGVKIIFMLVVISIMYVITALASGFAQTRALEGMNRVYETWVQLERYETKLAKDIENRKFATNMIVHYQLPSVQQSLSEDMPNKIAEIKQYYKEMIAIVDSMTEKDLAGVNSRNLNTKNNYK